MWQHLLFEFLGTGLMILFGVGVHCDDVLKRTKYAGSGHLFAITTWAFGISVCLFIFGGVCINPAMALAQAILGMIPWSWFVPYVIAEFLGAFVGACLVWFMYADHFLVEVVATTIFLTAIFAVAKNYESQLPIGVGLIVWAIGMGLGGTTGFAMNQARDLGPRLAYQVLPIGNKTDNDWAYGLIVPGTAPFVGAALAALAASAMHFA